MDFWTKIRYLVFFVDFLLMLGAINSTSCLNFQAGKGRTGLMVSSYLAYLGMSAEEAMQLYAEKRTTNNEGVSHSFNNSKIGFILDTTFRLVYYRAVIKFSWRVYSWQVSIASQRRYVGYWEKALSFPQGVNHSPPEVNLPKPCSRELRRIRLYDTVNIDQIFFVVSELQDVILG